jgi:copper chaperone CopZ
MRSILCALCSVSILFLTACAQPQKGASDDGDGVVHAATASERVAATSREPIRADHVTLYVNGLSCPLCATNVDRQLERLPGVGNVNVDFSSGEITLTLSGERRPSPHQIGEAVADAGFTLVKLETR